MVNENNQDWDKHPKKANRKRETLTSLGNSNIPGTRLADKTGREGGMNKEQETRRGPGCREGFQRQSQGAQHQKLQ